LRPVSGTWFEVFLPYDPLDCLAGLLSLVLLYRTGLLKNCSKIRFDNGRDVWSFHPSSWTRSAEILSHATGLEKLLSSLVREIMAP
jgi:hypothetical protein